MAVVRVLVKCPRCESCWNAAVIDTCTWWGKGLTAQQIARQLYCRTCHKAPPMIVLGDAKTEQLDLLGGL